jgi:maltose O-acetyltransferase
MTPFSPAAAALRARMLRGEDYLADHPELQQAAQRALRLTQQYATCFTEDPDAAMAILRSLLKFVGEEVQIKPPFYVDYGDALSIGPRTFINFGLMALDVAAIRIGADVQIGPNVQLLTPTHPIDPDARRRKIEAAQAITIEDNVWLGGGAIVLPGVHIGANSVVGAGAVVTHSLPANVVAVGNPARVVKTRI